MMSVWAYKTPHVHTKRKRVNRMELWVRERCVVAGRRGAWLNEAWSITSLRIRAHVSTYDEVGGARKGKRNAIG